MNNGEKIQYERRADIKEKEVCRKNTRPARSILIGAARIEQPLIY